VKEFFATRAVIAVFVIVVGAVFVALPMAVFAPKMCAARWAEWETDWGFIAGCRVEVNGRFMPEKNVRGLE
jgi:hypothetical protein